MSEKKKQLKKGFWSVEVDGFKGFIFVTQRKNPYTSEVLNHAIKRICTDYKKEEKKVELSCFKTELSLLQNQNRKTI